MATRNGTSSNLSFSRIQATYLIIAAVLLIFLVRLFSLQIIQGEAFQAQADDNRLDVISIQAPRGVIYDRNDFQLVRNIPSFEVRITPALLPESQAEIDAILSALLK